MARLRCHSCGFAGEIEGTGEKKCPRCGSHDVRAALSKDEIDDLVDALKKKEIPEKERRDPTDAGEDEQ